MNNFNNFNNFGGKRRNAGSALINQCPLCSNKYNPENLQILEEEAVSFLAHLTCSKCSSNLIVRVMVSPQGLVGTASVTDLTAGEVIRFRNEKTLSANEILDLTELINSGQLINLLP